MEVNKADLLKNIQNFIGAENDLAVKEALHQIGIFKAVYEQEVEAYEKLEEKEDKFRELYYEIDMKNRAL